ncbi:acid type B receptor subunit 1 [Seminavis robusta]|uniref:Acid type B receptor subunit 1 n=1 Tax=Seminavis robusta TaxID=568900 RepID=A0A9N8H6U5_9STRA|nr:acid type B receptor subunit 1 [Seminavis robusta]|eukprot:Sro53_g031380.1 acid type B receptor subunit 1 (1148) ;mRNA; r:59852-63852
MTMRIRQQTLVSLLPLLLILSLLPRCAFGSIVEPPFEVPSSVTLRAAVLHAPPFATVEANANGTGYSFSGFQVDLLERLKVFAERDNVHLDFDLTVAPSFYDAALNLVAHDCVPPYGQQHDQSCQQLDFILGNFYATPERAFRVDLSPAWLKSTIATIKFKDKQNNGQDLDFTTLTQASDHGGTVCIKDGTFYAGVVREKFPRANFQVCDSYDTCIDALKAEHCQLYADDELQLHYRAAIDSSLEVTPERFNTQWIVWPMSFELDPAIRTLMSRWIYAATVNATIDDLYHQYFQKALCPVGTAGANCELPCDPDHGVAGANGLCVCTSIKWTGDDCSLEVPEDTNSIPASLKALTYSMLAINVVVIIICLLWLHHYRFSQQVRYTQPFFLRLVLLGCLISSCTIIPMAMEDGGNIDNAPDSCMAIPWLYSVGFSVTFGTLFAKILRVYLIFTQAAEHQKSPQAIQSNTRRYYVTFHETLMVIGVVLLIDVAILVVWTVVDPLTWHRVIIREDQFGVPVESEGFCASDSWVVFGGIIGFFHLSLLAIACILCYKARDIPTKFSEGKTVSIAMISHLQIMVVGVPILIILGTSYASFFVRSVIIWMNDLAVVSLIFGNLMYSVYMTPPEDNRASFVRREISAAVSQFSKRKFNSSSSLLPPKTSSLPPPDQMEEFSASEPLEVSQNDNQQEASPSTSTPPLHRTPAPLPISSLTLGSTTTSSRKSVSWGMAYFSECGVDEETGVPFVADEQEVVPIVDSGNEASLPVVYPLPIDANSPPEQANRNKRFCSGSAHTAPQIVKRPCPSPESSEEFHADATNYGPIMPKRKSSVKSVSSSSDTTSTKHSGARSFSTRSSGCRSHSCSHSFVPQPRIEEECPECSGMLDEKDTAPSQNTGMLAFPAGAREEESDTTSRLSQLDESLDKSAQEIQEELLGNPRASLESAQGAPMKPDRRPTAPEESSSSSSVGEGLLAIARKLVPKVRLDPRKFERRPEHPESSSPSGDMSSPCRSRHSSEFTCPKPPQAPGRRNSSSFLDIDSLGSMNMSDSDINLSSDSDTDSDSEDGIDGGDRDCFNISARQEDDKVMDMNSDVMEKPESAERRNTNLSIYSSITTEDTTATSDHEDTDYLGPAAKGLLNTDDGAVLPTVA